MRFLDACFGRPTDATPVWFMRQAGRSLPEYRALREEHDILELCETPDLAVEVSMQPVRRLGVDAAIIFSDIVVPLRAVGVDLQIKPEVGPVIASPVRTARDVAAIRVLEPETDVPYVIEAVAQLAKESPVPVIGFAGAPFTLASYLIEGGPSKDHRATKAFMYSEPDAWAQLMDTLSATALNLLAAEVEAGAAAVQLFDSWIGFLSRSDYRSYVAPWIGKIVAGLRSTGAARILFGVGSAHLLDDFGAAGTEVVGVDWRIGLDDARAVVGDGPVLQGNLDPAVCLAPWDVVAERASDVLERGGGSRHIFNLGHGVVPETDPGILKALVDHVHGWSPS
ncbi:MAG TPA: uroporphyrinogen decarboxylase [Actinomycetota bacterium]|nr:uroporphyrinogen decarboxylase [Actinomycetota bacterium]